jgi:sugar lactone lactonase YvrE
MQTSSAAARLAFGLLLLGGCSGGLSSTSSELPAKTAETPSYTRSLSAPSTVSPFRLAVSDSGANSVELFNHQYSKIETITNGINVPRGDYYDDDGNLYVANTGGINVTEYNSSGQLIYTYSTGLINAVNAVTTDSKGNVYVTDRGYGSQYGNGAVVEYPQGSNTPAASCSTGLVTEGVVVDSAGDVFVSANTTSQQGSILEYVGGLSGCSSKTLPAKILTIAGGLQLDRKNNLVACDQFFGVAIIPPPYNKVKRTIINQYMHDANNLALNRKGDQLFVADINESDIWIYDYPSGKLVTALNESYGFLNPEGVAVYPVGK